MDIKHIQQSYYNMHHYVEEDRNKLLDFINSQYITGTISITEYKQSIYLLEDKGAQKPSHYFEGKYKK
ncbi:MAG: YppF family protein [Bacillaceae bacterium]